MMKIGVNNLTGTGVISTTNTICEHLRKEKRKVKGYGLITTRVKKRGIDAVETRINLNVTLACRTRLLHAALLAFPVR